MALWEKNSFWPPPKIERVRPLFKFSEVIHGLPEDLLIKFGTLTDSEFLQVAYSITPTNLRANNTSVYPFQFDRASVTWSRASKSPATNGLYILRQLAAVNVIETLWTEASREVFAGKVVFKKLVAIKKLLLLVQQNGVIPEQLCPINISPTFDSVVGILIRMLVIEHVSSWKTCQATCAKHICALSAMWSQLDAISGQVLQKYRARIRRAIKNCLKKLIVHSVLKWHTILGGTGADESSSALADAHRLAQPLAIASQIAFIAGPFSPATPTPFADAIENDIAPVLSGPATDAGPITATVEDSIGPLFTLT